jgi:hypothetical protein
VRATRVTVAGFLINVRFAKGQLTYSMAHIEILQCGRDQIESDLRVSTSQNSDSQAEPEFWVRARKPGSENLAAADLHWSFQSQTVE